MPEKSPQTLSRLGMSPVRGVIINEDFENKGDDGSLPRAMEFFFNPDTFSFDTSAIWARLAVPGLSHEVLQYSHTASNEMSFRIQWDWVIAKQRYKGMFNEKLPMLTDRQMENTRDTSYDNGLMYRDFLYALTLPVERGRAPSRVTIVWPGVIHTRGVITDVSFDFTRFHQGGGVMSFDADVKYVELRRVFLSRRGTQNYFERPPEDPPADEVTYVKRERKQGAASKTPEAAVSPETEALFYDWEGPMSRERMSYDRKP